MRSAKPGNHLKLRKLKGKKLKIQNTQRNRWRGGHLKLTLRGIDFLKMANPSCWSLGMCIIFALQSFTGGTGFWKWNMLDYIMINATYKFTGSPLPVNLLGYSFSRVMGRGDRLGGTGQMVLISFRKLSHN